MYTNLTNLANVLKSSEKDENILSNETHGDFKLKPTHICIKATYVNLTEFSELITLVHHEESVSTRKLMEHAAASFSKLFGISKSRCCFLYPNKNNSYAIWQPYHIHSEENVCTD